MSYIRFMNEAKDVPRIYLEKLGISTKRDNENTVGQFGSGAKFAPIAALRNGWEWAFSGTDQYGEYVLEYISKEELDGFKHIYYRYGEELKSSSFTEDAGVLSWDVDFQIFREAFANAIDEHIENEAKYSIDIVDNIEHIPGQFCVFITADSRLLDILNNFDSWFSFAKKPLYISESTTKAKIYTPVSETSMTIFHKGIFAAKIEQESLYDWELPKITLNEERRVRDIHAIDSAITTTIAELDMDAKEIISSILDAALDCDIMCSPLPLLPYEISFRQVYLDYISVSTAWANVWVEKKSEWHIPMSTAVYQTAKSRLRLHGYTPVRLDNAFVCGLLYKSGVQSPTEILGEEASFDIVTGSKLQNITLSRAMHIIELCDQGKGLESVEVLIFDPTDEQLGVYGVWQPSASRIYISTETLLLGVEMTVGTIIHELDHAITGLKDMDEEFRDSADVRIGRLMANMCNILEAE